MPKKIHKSPSTRTQPMSPLILHFFSDFTSKSQILRFLWKQIPNLLRFHFKFSSSSLNYLKTMESHEESEINGPHSMGTTIIGVTYNGGVVLGADSRTSTGKIQNFLISLKNPKKKAVDSFTVFILGFCRNLCCKSSIW